jgi:hypothetical protein
MAAHEELYVPPAAEDILPDEVVRRLDGSVGSVAWPGTSTAVTTVLTWTTTPQTPQPAQFRLDFLPSYSPELNPIERVWKLTRQLCLHNRYFGFLDGVVSAVEGQFAEWTKPNDILRRLCAIT